MSDYMIRPQIFADGVFCLPVAVADRLPLTKEAVLKVVLYVFRNADRPLDVKEIAKGAGVSETDAEDALLYWEEKGLLCRSENAALPALSAEAAPEKKEEAQENGAPLSPAEAAGDAAEHARRAAAAMKPAKPSYDMICKRMAESAAVRALFSEAQMKLGRTIGTADQASLLTLHDYYGMPAEIILAICEYARQHGKAANMNYIYTVGVDWSRRGIDTIEAADAELRRLEELNTEWPQFRQMTGIPNARPTPAQERRFSVWRKEWHFSFDMLALAYDMTVKQTGQGSFQYMNKVLSQWHKQGFTEPGQVEAAEKAFREAKDAAAAERAKASSPYAARNQKPAEPDRPASYDIKKAMEDSRRSVPKLKKKS